MSWPWSWSCVKVGRKVRTEEKTVGHAVGLVWVVWLGKKVGHVVGLGFFVGRVVWVLHTFVFLLVTEGK